MVEDKKKKRELKKLLTKLKNFKGRHTELVSVYIPEGYDIIKIIHHLKEEQSTASNIKDKRTRENVKNSLERMIRQLRLYKRTPEQGLAIFAGNISEKESQINIEVFSIEPPEPIRTRLYRCDQTFVTKIIEEMMDHRETYGLIAVDRREGTLGLLKGSSVIELKNHTSDVPGKTTKGGQSQARYARLRDEAAHRFFQRVAETANKEFSEKEIKGIIVGGPGHSKEDFVNGDYLQTRVKEKVLGMKDLSYTGEFGLNELVDKSHDILANEELVEEKKIMERFFYSLSTKGGGKAVYKEVDVLNALNKGAVDVLLLSEDLEDEKIEELEDKADNIGAKTMIISIDIQEGKQLKEFGGIAAILRFKV
jgi:peptide chain release factor subunit 1